MRYVSTRGRAPELGFADVLLAGLADDGGLYVPAEWPMLPSAGRARRRRQLRRDRPARSIAPFVGDDIDADELGRMCRRGLRHVPPPGRRAARADRRPPVAGRAVPRADARVQGRRPAARRPPVRPRARPPRRARHDRRGDQWRHRLGGDRGRARLPPRRHRHPLPARRAERGAAAADDHGRRARTCGPSPSRARSTTARTSSRRCSTTPRSASGCASPPSTRSTGRG